MRVQRLLGISRARPAPPLVTGVLLLVAVAVTAALSFFAFPVAAQNADQPSDPPGSLWVTVSLGVAFDDAYTRITKMVIPDRAYLLVEERAATGRRAVRVTRGGSDTDLVYRYTENGVVRPFDEQARAWFDAALEEGALEPLRKDSENSVGVPESRGAWLSAHLAYDREAERYVSFVRTDGVHLTHKEVTVSRADAGGFDQLTHYAAHDLVSDGELGSYLGAFIRNASGTQLELLTPGITRTVAEMEDESAKEAVSKVLETRLRGGTERQEPIADRALPAAIDQTAVGTPGRPAAPRPGEGVATGRVEWHTTPLAGVKVERWCRRSSGQARQGPIVRRGQGMKGKLSAVAGRSVTFVANFDRFEHQGRATTVRLTNVRLATGELLAEQACFSYTEAFGQLGLDPGDVVQFDAYTEPARRGGAGRLFDPTHLKKLPFDLWRGLAANGTPEVVPAQRPGLKRLTERERQVLELLASGLGNDEIAQQLGLSGQTVRNCLSVVYRKLGVGSRAEAVRWACEHGL